MPRIQRFREFDAGSRQRRENRWRFLLQALGGGVVLWVPIAIALLVKVHDEDQKIVAAWLIGALLFTLFVAALAVEARARLAHSRRMGDWHSLPTAARATALYAAVTVPIFVVVFSVVPLQEAKVCTPREGFAELGDLIGQTSDRVYLGERTRIAKRRIAVFPISQVEELFIGSNAAGAGCDPRSPQGVVAASLRRTEVSTAADVAQVAATRVTVTTSIDKAIEETRRVAEAALKAADATRAAGNVVSRTLPKRATLVWQAGADAGFSGASAMESARRAAMAPRDERSGFRALLELDATAAARNSREAERVVRRAVRAVLRGAKTEANK